MLINFQIHSNIDAGQFTGSAEAAPDQPRSGGRH
jgi:hypothetical protein